MAHTVVTLRLQSTPSPFRGAENPLGTVWKSGTLASTLKPSGNR